MDDYTKLERELSDLRRELEDLKSSIQDRLTVKRRKKYAKKLRKTFSDYGIGGPDTAKVLNEYFGLSDSDPDRFHTAYQKVNDVIYRGDTEVLVDLYHEERWKVVGLSTFIDPRSASAYLDLFQALEKEVALSKEVDHE